MTSPAEVPHKLKASGNFRGWLTPLAVSVGAALLVIAPFFWLGIASGHDITFHASSWLDAAGQWKEGIVYPRWTEWANYGFGEPRFIFYPPLSWMLGAALSLSLPGRAVPSTFIVLAQTIAGLCAFALARRLLADRAAILAAALYATNPYALLLVYMRSDYAEQLGAAFFPLLVLMSLELGGILENHSRSVLRPIGMFAAVFAAVWLSNVPAGVVASYTVALIFAWGALTEKSWRPLAYGAAGLALGFALSAVYLLPAIYEQRWVNIAQALSTGLLPSQNFLYTMIDDPEHTLFNWIASSVAILLMVMTGLGAVAAHPRMRKEEGIGEAQKLWRVMLFLSVVTAFLMMWPSSIFWEYLPKLRYVQFPWRWMSILAVAYTYFLAGVTVRRRHDPSTSLGASRAGAGAGWIWGAAVLVITAGTGTVLVQKTWWNYDDIPVLQKAIANDQGFEGTDEYDPEGDDHTDLPKKAARVQVFPAEEPGRGVPKAEIRIKRWAAEEKVIHVTSQEPLRLALRLLDYPAWQVEVNGTRVAKEHAEDTAQMILPLYAGEQRITIKFARTPDRSLGAAISAGAGIVFLALLVLGRPKRSTPSS